MTGLTESKVERILDCKRVKINGHRQGDIQVYDPRFYRRILTQGALGLGESYVNGWWDCSKLDVFFTKLLRNDVHRRMRSGWQGILRDLEGFLTNYPKWRAYQIGEAHYDLGNSFYQAMLGERMVYSCGYWKKATTLDEAQEAKLDLICRKLFLKKGHMVLDIGCGWGGFAKYAAQRYGVSVVGITVSRQQKEFADKICEGLPVEIRYQDYRKIRGTFDRVVSIGMFEHVGY